MAVITNAEVREAVDGAYSIAYDGCHKIYINRDETQDYECLLSGYGSGRLAEGNALLRRQDPRLTHDERTEELLTILRGWWSNSCSLRFIEAVSTNEYGAPEFERVIAQIDDEWEGVE